MVEPFNQRFSRQQHPVSGPVLGRSSRRNEVVPLKWSQNNPAPRNAEFTYHDCMNSIGRTRSLTRMNNHRCRHNPKHANAKTVKPINHKWVNFGENIHDNGYPEKMRNQRRANRGARMGFSKIY